MNQKPTIYAALAAGVGLLVLLFGLLYRVGGQGGGEAGRISAPSGLDVAAGGAGGIGPSRLAPPPSSGGDGDPELEISDFAREVLRMLREARAADGSVLEGEVVLSFKSEDAYRQFLASLGARGLRLLGRSDRLRSVRLGFDDELDLARELSSLDPSETTAGANYLVSIPSPPDSGESPGPGAGAVPFGRGALQSLGVSGDNSSFGEGVTVAVLDSGVQDHPVFAGKTIREFDLVSDPSGARIPIDPDNGHGTAVASIIAGTDGRLPGVAPAADLLSYRILNNDGVTDSFTLAEAITGAVDSGADIINVSLGSSGDSGVVRQAVEYAQAEGVLIVASSGNSGESTVSYPAAIEGVVAVSASDARGEHLDFANSGFNVESGGIAAPGYGVVAAWPGEQAISFSGTSASAPYVTGAVAAVMSEVPGLSAPGAYDLLSANSNEAGAPGPDPLYGAGNLDVARALQSGTAGIVDVAVASYHYDPVAAAESGTPDVAQVVVENRGTEPLHNVLVEVNSGDGARSYNVSFLPPGEIAVIDTPIDSAAGAANGALEVLANAKLSAGVNGADQNLSDNSLRTTVEFPGED